MSRLSDPIVLRDLYAAALRRKERRRRRRWLVRYGPLFLALFALGAYGGLAFGGRLW